MVDTGEGDKDVHVHMQEMENLGMPAGIPGLSSQRMCFALFRLRTCRESPLVSSTGPG